MLKGRLATLGLVFALMAAIAPFRATPALAAGCTGYSCEGKDPAAQGCGADAVTVRSANAWRGNELVATVELRYSAACKASWLRITDRSLSLNDQLFVQGVDGNNQPITYTFAKCNGCKQVYGPMTAVRPVKGHGYYTENGTSYGAFLNLY